MAFVNPNDPNAPNGQPQSPVNQQAPISSGGAGVAGTNKPSPTPGINVPAQPSAQLSSYLAANQPQAAAFGQNVAQDVAGQVNAAGAAIQPAVNTYTGNLYSVPTDPTVNAAVAASPSSLTPEQKTTFQKELGASAAGPNSAATFETTPGYQDAAGKIQKAVSQADLWNSGNSVSNLTAALAPYEGANATAGDRTLDSILLSRTPDSYKAIQAAVAPAAGYQDHLASGTASANDALRAAVAQNDATTPAALAAAKQFTGGLNSTLAGYLANAEKSVNDYNGQINPLAASYASVQPQIASLQDAVDAYNAILAGGPSSTGVGDLTSKFTPINLSAPGAIPNTIGIPDVAQLASSGQYSDIAALRDLLGDSYFGSMNSTLSPEKASMAGTWNPATNASIPSLLSLIDPVMSSANQGLTPNWTSMESFDPLIQARAPISQDIKGVEAALNALHDSVGKQPWAVPGGATPPPTPPADAIGPQNGQPGNEAWYNFITAGGPVSGIPTTYQGYLDQFNAGGIHVL